MGIKSMVPFCSFGPWISRHHILPSNLMLSARLPESEAQPRRGWFKDQTMGSHREIPEKKYKQIYRTNPIDTWLEGRNVWNLCIFIIHFCYSQFTWNDETMTSMHHPDDREFKRGNSNTAVRTVESFVLCGELMLINIGNSTSTHQYKWKFQGENRSQEQWRMSQSILPGSWWAFGSHGARGDSTRTHGAASKHYMTHQRWSRWWQPWQPLKVA